MDRLTMVLVICIAFGIGILVIVTSQPKHIVWSKYYRDKADSIGIVAMQRINDGDVGDNTDRLCHISYCYYQMSDSCAAIEK